MGVRVTQCISCKSEEFKPYCADVAQCKRCGLVVAEEIPTAKELHDLYQQDYFFGMEYADYEADRPALMANFKKRIARLKKSGALKKGDFVVELGCAYGYFLDLISDVAGDHIGFDVSEEGVEKARKRGHNTTTKDFLKYKIKDNSVDLVVMWDVIEHLTEPHKYIEKISRILKPGGHIALTTGDVEALIARRRGGEWRMIHPPTHVYYFSPRTLNLLFNQHQLKITEVNYKGISRNVGSVAEQIICNRKVQQKHTKTLEFGRAMLQAAGFHKLNIPLNTYDVMEVVAQKAA